MKELLGYVSRNKSELVALTNTLGTELTEIKDDVVSMISACNDNACETLRDNIQNLAVNVNFNQQVREHSEI